MPAACEYARQINIMMVNDMNYNHLLKKKKKMGSNFHFLVRDWKSHL